MHPPRVTQRRHKQVDLDPLFADPDLGIAEVDLKLMPWPSLEAHRRLLVRPQFAPPGLDPQLDRTQPNHDPVLARQLLADNIGIPVVPEEPFAKPVIQAVKGRLARCLGKRHDTAGAKVAAHRVARAAKFLRQPLGSPAKFMQPHHRGHLVRLKHLFSLHSNRLCRDF